MNKQLIFLIISSSILVLTAIAICVAPIINKIEIESEANWKPSQWGSLNCKIFADEEKKEQVELDELQKMRKLKNLCYRQKAIYGLEYSSFILDLILSFICANLALYHYLNVGANFVKKTGLIGLISGIIGFILTLVYVIYSGYIFTNDPAYGRVVPSSQSFRGPSNLIKLYPNGAKYKWDDRGDNTGSYITIYENEKGDFDEYVKYKDLGKKQYNYNKDYYKNYKDPNLFNTNCNIDIYFSPSSLNNKYQIDNGNYCDYLYYTAPDKVENKYIYDRWLTALILAVIIIAFNIALAIFGFLLFKDNDSQKTDFETVPIINNK